MKLVTLTNKSDKDILDFPISEATIGQDGNIVVDNNSADGYQWTGKTLAWSLNAGETKKFPVYVADILCRVYDFIDRSDDVEEVEKTDEKTVAVPDDGPISCKQCGRRFKNEKAFALHLAALHPEVLSKV